MPFLDSLDIANRALDHLGAGYIQSPSEDSVNNTKISMVYDKVRRAELRRNNWRFSIRRVILRPIDTTTFLLAPQQWNAATLYLPGSVVADENNQFWISTQPENIGNTPGASDVWEGYFGQMTADVFDTTGGTVYFAGDLVYIANADSSYVIYMSLQNSNTETPNVADTWSATQSYMQDQTVTYNSKQWRSLIALNLNNIPTDGPANWSSTTTYGSTNTVTGSDGFIYTSVSNGNLGNDPTLDSGANWTNTDVPNAWSKNPVIPITSNLWVPLYAGLQSINIVYPIGVGPVSQAQTKNIFRLPAGFLRQAPDDPKKGINPFLGAPAGRTLNDWEFEGNFIVSESSTPIMLRFVADIQTVSKMDDMFCEGLAARIGVEACEAITNSNAKQQTCNNAYNKFMGEARIVNAIEVGPIEPPEDEYITCRI